MQQAELIRPKALQTKMSLSLVARLFLSTLGERYVKRRCYALRFPMRRIGRNELASKMQLLVPA